MLRVQLSLIIAFSCLWTPVCANDVATLIQQSESKDNKVRENAVSQLSKMGWKSEATIQALVKSAADPEAQIRLSAVSGLGHRGWRGEAEYRALLTAVSDENRDVRYAALAKLSHITIKVRSHRVLKVLIKALSDPDWAVAHRASEIAQRFDREQLLPYLPELKIAATKNPHHSRAFPIEIIGTLGPVAKDILPILKKNLNQSPYGAPTFKTSAMAFARLAEPNEENLAFLFQLRKSASGYHIDPVLKTFAARLTKAQPSLLKALESKDLTLRRVAVQMAGEMREHGAFAVPAMLAFYLGKTQPWVGKNALEKMEVLPLSFLPRFMKLVQSGDHSRRRIFIRLIGNMGPEAAAALPILLAQLKSTDRYLLAATLRALGQLSHAKPWVVIPHLLQFTNNPEEMVRSAAQEGFIKSCRLHDPSLEVLRTLYKIANHEARAHILPILAQSKKQAAQTLALILEALNDPSDRGAALTALLHFEDRRKALPALMKIIARKKWTPHSALSYRVLGKCLNKSDSRYSTFLLNTLRGSNDDRSIAAATAIGDSGIQNKSIVSTLKEKAFDGSSALQVASSFALLKLGHTKWAVDSLNDIYTESKDYMQKESILQRFKEFPSTIRPCAPVLVDALAQNNFTTAQQFLRDLGLDHIDPYQLLLQTLTQPNPTSQSIAVHYLSLYGRHAPETFQAFQSILQGQDHSLIFAVLKCWLTMPPSILKQSSILLPLLKSKNSSEQMKVVTTLYRLGDFDDKITAFYTSSLSSKDSSYRSKMLSALSTIKKPRPFLLPLLMKSFPAETFVNQCSILLFLRRLRGQAAPAIPLLRESLKSGSNQLRPRVLDTLPSIGKASSAALPEILKLIQSSERLDRSSAASCLGHLGIANPAVIQALKKASTDNDEFVQFSAKAALKELTKKP